jgi:hypothetical protein
MEPFTPRTTLEMRWRSPVGEGGAVWMRLPVIVFDVDVDVVDVVVVVVRLLELRERAMDIWARNCLIRRTSTIILKIAT